MWNNTNFDTLLHLVRLFFTNLMKKIMILLQRDGPNVETIPLMTISNQVILRGYPCAMRFLEDNFYSPALR